MWATEFSISCRCFWGFPSCPSSFACPSPASDEMHKMHKLNLFNILNSFIAKYAYKMANADVRRCMQRGNAFNFQLCQLNLACAPEPIKSQQAKNKLKFAQVLLLLFKCCCCPFVVLFLFLLLNFLFVWSRKKSVAYCAALCFVCFACRNLAPSANQNTSKVKKYLRVCVCVPPPPLCVVFDLMFAAISGDICNSIRNANGNRRIDCT